jgi:hypothetical protein
MPCCSLQQALTGRCTSGTINCRATSVSNAPDLPLLILSSSDISIGFNAGQKETRKFA